MWIAFLALAGSAFAACGGGSGTGGGGLAFQAVWEQPATVAGQQVGCQGPLPTPVPSGFGPDIPDSVSLIQIEIEAADGSACCIRFLKQENRRRASFVDLPEGEAHLTISGFPAPEYAASSTLPECRLDRAAPNPPSFACAGEDSGTFSNPSFQSRRTAVQIPSAGSRNAGTIPISARPFVLLGECDGPPVVPLIAPPPGGTTNAIVGFIVADARGGIQQESVRATVLQGSQQFEMPLARTPCTDQEQGCSCRGAMGVTGVRNVGRLAGRISPVQPGPARLLISATSCDGQTEDFEYPFTYEPLADTPTATASITPVPTDTPTATASITPVPTETATTTPSASPTVTPTPRILLRITGDQVAVGDVGTLSVSLVVPQGVIVVDLDQRIGFSPQAIIIQDCAPSAPITDREFDWGFGSCEFNCDVLQATISRLDDQPLPSSVLYVCNFTINAMAGPGPHDLTCLDETTLTDRDGQVLRPICIPGEVEVISP